jgi:hypothetical protein
MEGSYAAWIVGWVGVILRLRTSHCNQEAERGG